MNEDKNDNYYVGNMAVSLYESVAASYPDIHSASISWLDASGDKLTMVLYKELDT
jgi:hypothetical protein